MSKTPPAAGAAKRKVRATKAGFYGGQRIKPKTVFTLKKPGDFTARWMVDVDPATPDDLEVLEQQAATDKAGSRASVAKDVKRGKDVGDIDVI